MNGKDRSGGRKKKDKTLPSFNPTAKLDPSQVKKDKSATAPYREANDRMRRDWSERVGRNFQRQAEAQGRQQMDEAGRAAAKKRGAKKASPPPKKKK